MKKFTDEEIVNEAGKNCPQDYIDGFLAGSRWMEKEHHIEYKQQHENEPPWVKAFRNLDITDFDKKELYDRIRKDLNSHDWRKFEKPWDHYNNA